MTCLASFHSVVEPTQELCSNSPALPSAFPLHSSCFDCNSNSKKMKCAVIISATFNILLKVFCHVDIVHLNRIRSLKVVQSSILLFH